MRLAPGTGGLEIHTRVGLIGREYRFAGRNERQPLVRPALVKAILFRQEIFAFPEEKIFPGNNNKQRITIRELRYSLR